MLHGICPLRRYSYLLSGTPRSSARMARKRLGNIFFPDIFDEIRKLCGFAYGIDHDALPMLR